jgi:hypothetical protein
LSFFGSFFGSDQREDLAQANKKATRQLEAGYADQQKQYGQAVQTLDPYAQGGQAGFNAYTSALGLNGQPAQQQVQQGYFNDPGMMGMEDLAQNRLLRSLNARGVSDSGQQRLASARVQQENYGNYLNRLMGLGQQGQQVAGAQSGLQAGMGDNAMGYGATRAGQAINHGNAMAQARGIGINNVLGTISAAAGAYGTAMGVPKKPT